MTNKHLEAYHAREEELSRQDVSGSGLFLEDQGFKGDLPYRYRRLADWAARYPEGPTRFSDLIAVETDPDLSDAERQALEVAIARQIAYDGLFRQSSRFERPTGDQRRRAVEFMHHTTEYYGEPDPRLFWQVYGQRRAWLESTNPPEGSLAAQAKARLVGTADAPGLLPKREEATEIKLPSAETIAKVGEWVNTEFADILALVDPKDPAKSEYGPEDLVELWNKTFALRQLDQEGWHSKLEHRPRGPLRTKVRQKFIGVPDDRKPVKPTKARKQNLHEFGHCLRSYNGEKGGKPLANTGLPGYSEFEETFMKSLEIGLEGKINPDLVPGTEDYLAIGLTRGVDGKLRTAEEIKEIFYNIKLLKVSAADPDISDDAARQKAEEFATIRAKSIFRGTPGTIPGTCFTYNLAYFQNFEKLWNLYARAKDVPRLMRYLMSGKFNPFDPIHTAIMGPIPE